MIELLNNRNKHHKTKTTLEDPNNNNQVTNDPSRIPNILNEHFASVGTKLASKLPTKRNHMDYLKKLKSPVFSFFSKPISTAYQTHGVQIVLT